MGIFVVVVTPTQAEEEAPAAEKALFSSSSTNADIALHRTMGIMCVVLWVGFGRLVESAFYSPPVY
jgi:spore maturation protein SpmA